MILKTLIVSSGLLRDAFILMLETARNHIETPIFLIMMSLNGFILPYFQKKIKYFLPNCGTIDCDWFNETRQNG
jgi:hypothetical protein